MTAQTLAALPCFGIGLLTLFWGWAAQAATDWAIATLAGVVLVGHYADLLLAHILAEHRPQLTRGRP